MKGKRHSPEQIVSRHLEVSVQTYQRWRSQFKAMRPEDVVRLMALEKENTTLRSFADKPPCPALRASRRRPALRTRVVGFRV